MTMIGPINMGNLPNYLLFFADGRSGANWQGASKGFVGDVAVDGLQAIETTSGYVPYAGTIYTNAPTLGAWQKIVDDNVGQAFESTNEIARIAALQTDLISAFSQINALPATPGFESRSATSLNGLNYQNGVPDVVVINVTSGFQVSSKIYITGDAEDIFILRWDSDLATPGYQGEVKFQSGGAIVPLGGLKATNFINVAGDINSSGGGTTPPPPYPQGPRYNDGLGPLIVGGQDFNGGGFFTGYWLTTGTPTMFDPTYGEWIGPTHSLSNAIFAGGWYTLTTDFSMTSGTSGVWVSPPPAQGVPGIAVKKYVSVTGPSGPFFDADNPPGPTAIAPTNPVFRYVVTNTGGVALTDVTLTDSVLGPITLPTSALAVGESTQVDVTGTFAEGQQFNNATASGQGNGVTVTAENPAYYVGAAAGIVVQKDVWDGTAWVPADFPPGPYLPPSVAPQFRFIVTNPSNVPLTNVVLTDDVYGTIASIGTMAAGSSAGPFFITDTWATGEHHNVATASGDANGVPVSASNPAYWTGAANAALTIQKLINNLNTPPCPVLNPDVPVVYTFIVTNTGGAPLAPVTVTDSVLGPIGSVPLMNPGDQVTFTRTATWASGAHSNTATATGTFDAIDYTATDTACYTGNTPPTVNIVSPPCGSVVSGTVPLHITAQDAECLAKVDLYIDGQLVHTETVPSGGLTADFIYTWNTTTYAEGPHAVEAVATDCSGLTATVTCTFLIGTPALTIQKLVNGTATPPCLVLNPNVPPVYTFIVTNTGSAPLAPVTVTDITLGPIGSVPLMNPGDVVTFTKIGTWAAGGPHYNTATATGTFNATDYTATAQACFFGNTPPTVHIVSPPCGTVVTGTVPLHITAQDAECLAKVDLYIDGQLVHTETVPGGGLTADFIYNWNTTTFVEGPHAVEAVATDCNGLTATVTCTFLVGAPGLTIRKLVNGAATPPCPVLNPNSPPVYTYIVTNTGGAPLAPVTVTDSVLGAIGSVPLMNPGDVRTFTKTGTWAPGGPHYNTATATGIFNGASYIATAEACFVGNTPPTVHIPSPPSDSTVCGTVPILVTAQDAECLSKVDLYIDGRLVYTDTVTGGALTTSFVYNWNTVGYAEGPHTVTAVATDCSGLTATTSNTYIVHNLPACHTQLLVNGNLAVPEQKPDIEEVISLDVTPMIHDVDAFSTIDGTKFAISGTVELNLTYAAVGGPQEEHFAHFLVPFSTTVLCPQLGLNDNVEPVLLVEHVQWHLIDPRRVKKLIVLFVGIRPAGAPC